MPDGELLPSAGRLMSSLRDIGYDVTGAIADLVDNSIDACSRRIDIEIVAARGDSHVRVLDDGLGMTEGSIEEAMRFGTRRRYSGSDLGSFGLGLKTASLSQARRLTVASRTTPTGPTRIRQWDLDKVIASDRWLLARPGVRHAPHLATAPLRGARGTVVLWENLDRLVGSPATAHTERVLNNIAAKTAEHLAMVFHRFISGEAGGTPIKIAVNGNVLAPWDPFARDEPSTRSLPTQGLNLDHDGVNHPVAIQPYVLPAQHQFSTIEAHALAAGPNRWNRQQGLYIYRRERLIQSGGWARLRTTDEHSKLARIAVDIPPGVDEAFSISVTKMRVGLPEALRAPLRAIAAGVVATAQERYRQHAEPDGRNGRVAARPPGEDADGEGWSIGGDWPQITAVLRRELQSEPVLDRVLVSLANAHRTAVAVEER